MGLEAGFIFGFGAFFGFIGAIIGISILCVLLYYVGMIIFIVSWLPYYAFRTFIKDEDDIEKIHKEYWVLMGIIGFILLCNLL